MLKLAAKDREQLMQSARDILRRAYAEGNLSEASRITDNDLESLSKHASTTCLLDFLEAAATSESAVTERELGKIKLVGERLRVGGLEGGVLQLEDGRVDADAGDLRVQVRDLLFAFGDRRNHVSAVSD